MYPLAVTGASIRSMLLVPVSIVGMLLWVVQCRSPPYPLYTSTRA